jgi:protein-S-isoprenylcysteine O-methyltransferase Ste14
MRSALKISAATILYAGLHSLLASRAAKRATARLVGERRRNAFYRPFYLVQSFGTLALLAWYVRKQPARVLWDVRGPARWVMRAGQAASLGWAVWAASEIGLSRVFGVTSVQAYGRGEAHVPKEPEAQGPAEREGRMYVEGPFRWSRHPLNFAPIPIFWLNPTMTTRLLAFTVTSTVYFFVGSSHEEHRLEQAYGNTYREYMDSGRSFLIPGRQRTA